MQVGSQRRRSSMEQQSIASAASGGSAAEQRRAAVDRNLSDLHSRRLAHSEDDGSEGNQRSGMKVPPVSSCGHCRSHCNRTWRLACCPEPATLECAHSRFLPSSDRQIPHRVVRCLAPFLTVLLQGQKCSSFGFECLRLPT